MATGKKIYFASDLHLGAPDQSASLQRERHFIKWLEYIRPTASELYLVGDLFDFWFEYGKVVPKGYVRLLGKLAEMSDQGIKLHLFYGNHDLWQRTYFQEQLGAEVHPDPIRKTFFGKEFFIGHGDGLGPGDHGYKFLKRVFRNPISQWLFHRLHPNFGIALADFFSKTSRKKTGHKDAIDFGEKEFLHVFCREKLLQEPEIDYFVFGHRHLPKHFELEQGKYYCNLGDWITHFTYLEASPEGVEMYAFPMGDAPSPQPFPRSKNN